MSLYIFFKYGELIRFYSAGGDLSLTFWLLDNIAGQLVYKNVWIQAGRILCN